MEKKEYGVFDMVNSRIRDAGGIEVDGKKLPLKIVLRRIDGRVPEQAVRAVKEWKVEGGKWKEKEWKSGKIKVESGKEKNPPVAWANFFSVEW